jgi:hypothetical protein
MPGQKEIVEMHFPISVPSTTDKPGLQLDLFGRASTPAPSLIGQHVRLDRACYCGCATAILGSSCGPHAGELRCVDCDRHMGWASHALAAEIRGSGFVTGISSFEPGCRP